MVRYKLRFTWLIDRAGRLSVRKLEIVIHEQMDHDLLDLVGGEEAARTSMPAVTKGHVLQVTRGPLQTPGGGEIFRRAAEIGKAKAIKDLGVGE